jgi:hypothetical protein
MSALDFDAKNLSMLPPEERLKKLKELEKKRQQELKEAEKLIRQSIEELHREEDAKKEAAGERQSVQTAPQKIFEDSGKSGLEEALDRAKPDEFAEEEQIRRQQQYTLERYDELREMRETGSIYNNQERAFELYREIMQSAKYQSQNDTVSKVAQGSSRMMEELFGDDRQKAKYFP